MNRILIPLLFILIFEVTNISSQQNCNLSNRIDLSTGLSQNNTQINIGEVDNYWKLVIIPPLQNGAQQHSSVEIPKLYRVPTLNAYWNVTGAAILSPKNITNFPENNAFANQPWRIRRYFCIVKKGNYKLEGEYRCDDTGSLSLHKVDGTQLTINNTQSNGFNSGTQINHLLSLDAGSYYVEARILNTRSGHMGFSFKGSLTAQGSDLLSPQDNETCCPVGSINILKIIDKNCNGKYDSGDEIGVNWQFEVYKNNIKIGTITTNNLGEASLGGLTSGNYIIKELEKSGYYPYQSIYNQNITLHKNDSKQITFFNCLGSLPPTNPTYPACCPPILKEDLASLLNIEGNLNNFTPEVILTPAFKQRIQAYINYRKAIDPCLEHFDVQYWIKKPVREPDVFDFAQNTNLSVGATTFKPNQTNTTTWGQPTLSNITLEGNRWYRFGISFYGGPEKCSETIQKECSIWWIDFNLNKMQIKSSNSAGKNSKLSLSDIATLK